MSLKPISAKFTAHSSWRRLNRSFMAAIIQASNGSRRLVVLEGRNTTETCGMCGRDLIEPCAAKLSINSKTCQLGVVAILAPNITNQSKKRCEVIHTFFLPFWSIPSSSSFFLLEKRGVADFPIKILEIFLWPVHNTVAHKCNPKINFFHPGHESSSIVLSGAASQKRPDSSQLKTFLR